MFSSRKRWLAVVVLPLIPFIALGQTIRSDPVPPNFLLDISREFLEAAIAQTIDRTDPVHDVILKTRITGTGRTIARVAVELVPNEEAAVVDIVTTGTTYAETVGVNGPVQLYNDSVFPFQIHQRVYLRPEGVLAEGARSQAEAGDSTLTGLTTKFHCLLDRLVKKIACNQYRKSKDEAQNIALLHAERQLNESAEAEAGPRLRDADEALKKNLAELRADGINFAMLRFTSAKDTVFVRAASATRGSEAYGTPPQLAERSYLALRVHETMINESAQAKLGGKTFTGEQMAREARKLGSPDAPMKQEDKDFSITFTKNKPLEVTFADQGWRAVVRLQEFSSGDDEYAGMDMTVKYKFQVGGDKIKAVRQGVIEAFPPGFKVGQKLSARQQAMRTVLQKRFGKFFKEEMPLQDIELSKELEKAGTLVAARAEAERGWLLMTWRKGGD
jgi:hypothetical protein